MSVEHFGVVIHELTHVIQAYPAAGDKPGWLVEGIAASCASSQSTAQRLVIRRTVDTSDRQKA